MHGIKSSVIQAVKFLMQCKVFPTAPVCAIFMTCKERHNSFMRELKIITS